MRQAARVHESLVFRIASGLAVALLLASCARAPQAEGETASRRSATSRDAPPAQGPTPEDRAYYAALVAAHGQDTSTCPPADAPAPDACADGRTPGESTVPRRVLLMLDASGSMASRQGPQSKLAIAQDALLGFAAKLDPAAQVGLRVYGHRGSNRDADKAASCRGTELILPFAARDQVAFETAVRSFEPRGFTPIAASLQAAAQDFTRGGASAEGNVVYLVSDGIETCDGDPAAAARALHASGIHVVVNVIGFDVDAGAERQLRDVATAGGGEYITARSRDDLEDVFNTRVSAATATFGCVVGAEVGAFNTTVDTHTRRWTCLVGKAVDEYTAIIGAAADDSTAGRITAAQRTYAMQQAALKRDSILKPANATRDAAVDGVSSRRTQAIDAAQRERDAALDAAESQRAR